MLARKTLLHFLNTVVGGVLGAVALKLIALYMGDAILGNVAYAIGLISLVQALFASGFRRSHEKRIGEGTRQGDKIATYVTLQVGLNALFGGLVLGAIGVWTFVLGQRFHSTTLMVMVIVAAYLIAQNFRQVATNTFNGRREIARSQTITFLDDLARVGFTVIATTFYAAVAHGKGPFAGMLGADLGWIASYGPELLAMTYLGGTLVSALIGLAYVRRTCPWGSFDREVLDSYWQFAWPLLITGLLGSLVTNVDRVMLGYFWTGAVVGLYFGMDRVVHMIRSLAFALNTVLMPAISHMAVEEDREGIADVAFRSHRYSTMVVLPMIVGVIVFADDAIRLLLANEFLRGVPVLIALAVWVFFNVASTPYGSVILGLDRSKLILRLSIVAVAINVGLNALLIPADIKSLGIELFGLGALGAALATLVATAIRYVGLRYYVGKLIPIDSQWPHLPKQLLAVVLMGAVLWWTSGLIPGPLRWYHLLLFGLGGLALYTVFLRLLGELTDGDVAFFLDALDPSGMADYVTEELPPEDE